MFDPWSPYWLMSDRIDLCYFQVTPTDSELFANMVPIWILVIGLAALFRRVRLRRVADFDLACDTFAVPDELPA